MVASQQKTAKLYFPTQRLPAYFMDIEDDRNELLYVMLLGLLASAVVHGLMSGLIAL